jgi:hypothetical protein
MHKEKEVYLTQFWRLKSTVPTLAWFWQMADSGAHIQERSL